MTRTTLIVTVVVVALAAACGRGSGLAEDVVATVQVDDDTDVIVVRVDDSDALSSLRVCRVPHGDRSARDTDRCAEVDPWRWSRRSISASLDPGPESSLLVVVPDQAEFSIVDPSGFSRPSTVDLHLPAGPIGSHAPLALKVVLAESELTADNAIGCLTTGLAGGTNPVFIAAGSSSDSDDAGADRTRPVTTPGEVQTACV